MGSLDRLSALDTSFLRFERGGAHMHVGSCMVFAGDPPPFEALLEHVRSRLHLVPRYRQKVIEVPYGLARPVWVDDSHFNLEYHVQRSALPSPGSERDLQTFTADAFSQRLDRGKPLWEMHLVEGLDSGPEGPRFALVSKAHHCLVDGIAGVDLTSVLFDTAREARSVPGPREPWQPRPQPSSAELLAAAVAEQTGSPLALMRAAADAARRPVEAVERTALAAESVAALALTGFGMAPPSPFNGPIGLRRRFAWATAPLTTVRELKRALLGTVNDVVLTVVAGALRRFLGADGYPVDDMELKALVPVSVRASDERGALGNRVSAMYAPLPLHAADPLERFVRVREAMGGLKQSGQAVGGQVLTRLANYAPPTILAQAARLQAHARFFNLVITNVPGPQRHLYLCGRRLEAFYPQVPLPENVGLGIAVLSHDGRLCFGILGDWETVPRLAELPRDVDAALAELVDAAGVPPAPRPHGRRPLSAAALGRARG